MCLQLLCTVWHLWQLVLIAQLTHMGRWTGTAICGPSTTTAHPPSPGQRTSIVQATVVCGYVLVISFPLLLWDVLKGGGGGGGKAALLLLAKLLEFYLRMIHSISPTPSHSEAVKQYLKSSVFTSLFLRLVVRLYSPLQIFLCGRHSCLI